jgi:hypothetical protein
MPLAIFAGCVIAATVRMTVIATTFDPNRFATMRSTFCIHAGRHAQIAMIVAVRVFFQFDSRRGHGLQILLPFAQRDQGAVFQPLRLLNVFLSQRKPGKQAVLPPNFRKRKREIRYRVSGSPPGSARKVASSFTQASELFFKYPGRMLGRPRLACEPLTRQRSFVGGAASKRKVSLSVPFLWGTDRPLPLPGRLDPLNELSD